MPSPSCATLTVVQYGAAPAAAGPWSTPTRAGVVGEVRVLLAGGAVGAAEAVTARVAAVTAAAAGAPVADPDYYP